MSRIVVLHNTDGVAIDASSVEGAALAVAGALDGEVVAMRDVVDTLAHLRADPPELIFNLCESIAGDTRNEPTFVGLLDLFGLRYTGSDLLCLASCLHKQRCKDILLGAGVATPPHRYYPAPPGAPHRGRLPVVPQARARGRVARHHRGQHVAHTPEMFSARLRELVGEFRQGVLAERYITGREINVGFLGDQVLPLHEIDFAAMPADRPRIVSYAAKWDEAHVDYAGTKPVPLTGASVALVAAIEEVARAAYAALGLRDYGRVDLRVDASGQPWVIDVNPNCDVSPDAGMTRAAHIAGLSYEAMIRRIAELARAR